MKNGSLTIPPIVIIIIFLVIIPFWFGIRSTAVMAFDSGTTCNEPLGMESGAIPDGAITASSSYVPNVGPRNGRLRVERAGGGWCPKQQVARGVREYLEVDLDNVFLVTGIQTQGRYDRGRGQEYTEEYTVEYWRPGLPEWRQYRRWDNKEVLRGNSDTASVESHRLMPPVFATKIRVLPFSVHRRTVCLRVELLGCPYQGAVVAYRAPESSEPAQGLGDLSYDGVHAENGQLVGGLGRLVDGERGGDNFRLDIGYGRGNGWIGWRNDTFPDGYVELVFEFDQVRNFSALHLFTNNYFSRNVQAKVAFSVGGNFYSGPTLSYTFQPDRVHENARNVTIDLHQRLGRFVNVKLYFGDRWLMLGEVVFDSVGVGTATALNMSEEMGPDLEQNVEMVVLSEKIAPDSLETIAARTEGDSYVEVVIGVLTAIVLLLLVVFMIVLIINKRHKLLQGGGGASPSTILRNPFGAGINMKDFLLIFSRSPPPPPPPHPITPPTDDEVVITTQLNVETQSPLLVNGYCAEEQSPLNNNNNYRSLQSTPITGGGGKLLLNLGNYFPRVNTEPPHRKRYHTAPRHNNNNNNNNTSKTKKAPPPPVICWNIAPSMLNQTFYSGHEVELTPIPCYTLRPLEKIGACHAGEITLYETAGLEDLIPDVCRVVAVRTAPTVHLEPTMTIGSNNKSRDSLREVRFLAGLTHPNICSVLGICTVTDFYPPWTVLEYGDMGDLAQYLQFLIERNQHALCTDQTINPDEPLSINSLLYMVGQIASGMMYLESKQVVHKDLAARNCLVGRGCIVKIADVAMVKPQYRKDYAEIGGRPPAPIRWLPWESILLDRYVCPSSVWSFGVTVWEIFNYCCERPFGNLSNEKVIQNAEHMYYGGELQVLLNKPTNCSSDIYDVLCQCWRRDDTDRPTFQEIYTFLTHYDT